MGSQESRAELKNGGNNSRPAREKYYLNITQEVANRSTCYRAHGGAIIVRDDQIIATGYIGAPRGTSDCVSHGFCLREKLNIPRGQRYEMCRSVHAEQNAIINAARAGVSLLDGDMYLWGKKMPSGEVNNQYPCFICKKMIINAGIRRVICGTSDGGMKIFHVEDWKSEWRNNDMIDDEHQYGAGANNLTEKKSPEKSVEIQEDNNLANSDQSKLEEIKVEEARTEAESIPQPEISQEVNLNQNSMDKKIIAVTSLPGGGKSEVVKRLVEKGFKKIYFGEVTFDEIKRRELELTPQNEKLVREDLRKKYGMAAFAILNIEKIRQAYSQGNVVIESMYSWQEYLKLKDEFGDNFHVIAVQAQPKIRHERIVDREEYQQGMKRTFTLEEVKERDINQIENIAIAGPIAMADYTIINEGDLDNLDREVNRALERLIG